MSARDAIDALLVPGGALAGPLFARLLQGRAVAAETPGRRVGNYRLESVLGRGGSSVVYRAQRADGAFEQTIALKLLRPERERSAAYRRERDILGAFHHPGIALILDGGETPDGEAWYAMEYVDGLRIDRWCAQHDAEWRTRVRLLVDVCDAVHFAHGRLIVHQDLKPSNILVDAHGHPRLLDFGISRCVREATASDGRIALTPGVASPEQLAGAPATMATDVYQLGHLLQGLVAPESLPRLTARNLAAVVARATAERADERYAGVAELRSDLLRMLDGRPAAARSWPGWLRAAWFARRNALPLSVTGAAVLALCGFAAYYTTALRAERDRAAEQARSTLVSNEVLANLFRTAAPSLPLAERVSAAQVLDRGADTTLRRLGDAPQQRAIAAAVLAATYLDLHAVDKARALLDAVLATDAGPAPDQARLLVLRARAALEEGRPEDAAPQLDAAAALLAARPDLTLDHAALDAQRIALLARRGDVAGANAARQALLARMDAQDLASEPLYATLLKARADEYAYANRYADAARDAAQAQAIVAQHYGPTSPQALAAERDRVWLDLMGGALAEADQRLAAQRAAVRDSFGENALEFAEVVSFEGAVAAERGRYDEARPLFEQAYAIARARLEPDAAELARHAHNVADVALAQGDAAAALPLYEEALRVRRLRYADNYEPVLINRLQIARAQCELDRFEAANTGFAAARSALAQRVSPGHAYAAVAAALHAQCLLRQQRVAEARALFDAELPPERLARLSGTARSRVERVRAALERAERVGPAA